MDSYSVLEPKTDAFRNYLGHELDRPAPENMIDQAHKLTLTAPEMTALVGGMRVLGTNADGMGLGILTDNPGTLTNDFFTNLLDMNAFLALEIRVILLFGVSFLLPVVLVLLNLIHVLSSAQLKAARKWSIFGFFCLGAFVNPSGDPISMCALAIPLSVMYVIAEWICRSNERKRSTGNMGIDKSEFDIQID